MQVIGLRLRTHFSLHHAQAAAFHARQACRIELDDTEESAIAICAHVSAAVVSSTAFVEATANEISENDDRPRRNVHGQPSALLKLNELLEDRQVSPIEFSAPHWQSAKTLIDLRNRLVHYSHDWLDWGTENELGSKALSKSDLLPRLRAEFSFLPASHTYSPRFLSPECAVWAVNTGVAFLDEFFLRLGQPAYHDHLRHRIEIEQKGSETLFARV